MCRTFRIPHSALLGWSDVDAALAVAYEQWRRLDQATRCQSCGTRPEDWLDDDGKELRDAAWELETVTCVGCRRRDAHQEDLRRDGDTAGITVQFRRPWAEQDDDDDLFDTDHVVYRWEPDDPTVEAAGAADGLARGDNRTAPLADLPTLAASGWIVARGPDDQPLRASRPDASDSGTV